MSRPASSVEWLRDRASLERVAQEWRALPQAQGDPLLGPEWSLAALPALHAEPMAVAIREAGALTALAPLTCERSAGWARLEILGARYLNEPAGFQYRDLPALDALCAAVIGSGLPVILNRVPAQGAEMAAFARAARGRGKLLVRPASPAPVVNFPADFAGYESTLSARRRQDYRRFRRKLEAQGPVTFDLRLPSAATVGAELAEAMRIEAAGWKTRRGSALAQHPRLGPFFDALAPRMAARGLLRICYLRVGGQAIATQICIEQAGRWWILKIGYDEQWAQFSPGIQLMWDVVRHAGESRLGGVEMLGSAEEWISIWTRELREFRTLVFYPWNGRGAGAFVADATFAIARRLRR